MLQLAPAELVGAAGQPSRAPLTLRPGRRTPRRTPARPGVQDVALAREGVGADAARSGRRRSGRGRRGPRRGSRAARPGRSPPAARERRPRARPARGRARRAGSAGRRRTRRRWRSRARAAPPTRIARDGQLEPRVGLVLEARGVQPDPPLGVFAAPVVADGRAPADDVDEGAVEHDRPRATPSGTGASSLVLGSGRRYSAPGREVPQRARRRRRPQDPIRPSARGPAPRRGSRPRPPASRPGTPPPTP